MRRASSFHAPEIGVLEAEPVKVKEAKHASLLKDRAQLLDEQQQAQPQAFTHQGELAVRVFVEVAGE